MTEISSKYIVSSAMELQSLPGFDRASAIQRGYANLENEGTRSPIFFGEEGGKVLENWASSEFTPESIDDLEQRELEKAGPYYNYKWDVWKENLFDYFTHPKREFSLDLGSDPLIEEAYKLGTEIARYNGGKVAPLQIHEAYKRARKSTNLGYPDVTSNWESANLGYYLRRAQSLIDGKATKLYPFVMFKRVQPGGFASSENPRPAKQRPVWGADHAETFSGLTVLYPCLDAMSKISGYSHLKGIDHLEASVQSSRYTHWLSLDLSTLDRDFGPWLINVGLLIVSQLIDLPETYLTQVYEYYSSGPIHTPGGLVSGIHGMPSGVSLTNLLETLVLTAIARVALREQGLDQSGIWQNGDDGLFGTTEEIDKPKFTAVYGRYGLSVNETKSTQSTDYFSYLQRHFFRDLGFTAVMSTTRMLNRILFSETSVNLTRLGISPKQYWTLNTISKLENCKRHPQFEYFIDFVRRGDKFNIHSEAVAALDPSIIEGYSVFGDDGSQSGRGIGSYLTVQYLARSMGMT